MRRRMQNTNSKKNLEKLADQILREAGLNANAQPIGQKSVSIPTVRSVPMGGSGQYRLRMRRP